MNLTIKSLNLKLKYPFRISRETRTVQNNILVILEDEDGTFGLGEAAPVKYYGEDVKSVKAALRKMSKFLVDVPDPFHIEDITNVGATLAVAQNKNNRTNIRAGTRPAPTMAGSFRR